MLLFNLILTASCKEMENLSVLFQILCVSLLMLKSLYYPVLPVLDLQCTLRNVNKVKHAEFLMYCACIE